MTTYVYEAIPQIPDENRRFFEIKQRMNDAPIAKHPETGEPIRRVVLGGIGVLISKLTSETAASSCGCCCECH